jgi:hypothetical protein
LLCPLEAQDLIRRILFILRHFWHGKGDLGGTDRPKNGIFFDLEVTQVQ